MNGQSADSGVRVRVWFPGEAVAIVGGEEDSCIGANENPTGEFGVSDDGVDMGLTGETTGLGQRKTTPPLGLLFGEEKPLPGGGEQPRP